MQAWRVPASPAPGSPSARASAWTARTPATPRSLGSTGWAALPGPAHLRPGPLRQGAPQNRGAAGCVTARRVAAAPITSALPVPTVLCGTQRTCLCVLNEGADAKESSLGSLGCEVQLRFTETDFLRKHDKPRCRHKRRAHQVKVGTSATCPGHTDTRHPRRHPPVEHATPTDVHSLAPCLRARLEARTNT